MYYRRRKKNGPFNLHLTYRRNCRLTVLNVLLAEQSTRPESKREILRKISKLSFLPSTRKIDIYVTGCQFFSFVHIPIVTIPGLDKPLTCQIIIGVGRPVARHEN